MLPCFHIEKAASYHAERIRNLHKNYSLGAINVVASYGVILHLIYKDYYYD
tara:strand:- start:552 stop:704 length:153 start_codon:yes stop_codon:yes gene_type:complete